MLVERQTEDIILVLLFVFLLCIYNMSVHDQEDKKTLWRRYEKSWNWERIDGRPAIKMITEDRKGGRKSILLARKKIPKIFFQAKENF